MLMRNLLLSVGTFNFENNQIEVFPVPANNSQADGTDSVRIHGIRNLSPLVAESDLADLDDQLIVLFAASEILARQTQADANKNLHKPAHYARLKARNAKTETFVIGGEELPDNVRRPRHPIYLAPTQLEVVNALYYSRGL